MKEVLCTRKKNVVNIINSSSVINLIYRAPQSDKDVTWSLIKFAINELINKVISAICLKA